MNPGRPVAATGMTGALAPRRPQLARSKRQSHGSSLSPADGSRNALRRRADFRRQRTLVDGGGQPRIDANEPRQTGRRDRHDGRGSLAAVLNQEAQAAKPRSSLLFTGESRTALLAEGGLSPGKSEIIA